MKIANGLTLPSVENVSIEIDRSQFPYAFIMMGKNNYDEWAYTLLFASKPLCFNPTTKTFEIKLPFDMRIMATDSSVDMWVQLPQDDIAAQEDLVLDNLYVTWYEEALEYATTGAYLAGIDHDITNSETGEIAFMWCNDIILPSIPSDIERTQYPYAYIIESYENDSPNYKSYMLMVLNEPLQTNSDDGYYMKAGTSGFGGFMEEQYEWTIQETGEVPSDMPMEAEGCTMSIFWSEVAEEKLYPIKKGTLKSIADSIRAKTGKTDLITPEDMPTLIGEMCMKKLIGEITLTKDNLTASSTTGSYTLGNGLSALMTDILTQVDAVTGSIVVEMTMGDSRMVLPAAYNYGGSSSLTNIQFSAILYADEGTMMTFALTANYFLTNHPSFTFDNVVSGAMEMGFKFYTIG